jgi:predicted RNase H-like HicB family nuclease
MSKTSDRYVKVVAWSEEDQCYVGRCPGLMLGGVHGSDEQAVYAELCEAVDEWIRLHEAEGRPLPRSTSLREIEALVWFHRGRGKTLLASPAFAKATARQARLRRDYGEAGIAIDRFDGTIVGQQLEEVTE